MLYRMSNNVQQNNRDPLPSAWNEQQLVALLRLIFMILLAAFCGLLLFYLLVWHDPNAVIGLGVAVLCTGSALWMALRGLPHAASLLLSVALMLIVTGLATLGQGIHDIAVVAYPAILVGFSMMLEKRAQVWLALLTIAAIGWLVFGALAGLFVPRPASVGSPADFVVVTTILLVTSGATQLLTGSLRHSLTRARQEIAERVQAEAAVQASEERYRAIAAQAQQRAERLAMLNEVGRAVSTLRDLDGLLETIYQQARRSLRLDAFFIGMLDHGRSTISFPISYDCGQRYVEADQALSEDSYVSRMLTIGKPLLISLNEEQTETIPHPHTMIGDVTRRSASLMFAPLIAGEQVIGAISAQSYTPLAYGDDDLALLTGIAHQAAVAIENARLYATVQQELARRQRLIQELESQKAELERFTYTVSHDLKSPLITIAGFLGFLEQSAHQGDTARLQADITRITAAVARMRQLLDELLELSRIGRLMNPPEQLHFAWIVAEALTLLKGRLDARKVAVCVQHDLPQVYGDPVRLREVVQNLVENAVKFLGPQPEPQICIGVREQDGEPVFYVQDNGIGIAPEYQQRIFGLFDKLDPQSEGTGVGLALVKRIVEVHGGRIWVESTPGQGATFCFTLAGAVDSSL